MRAILPALLAMAGAAGLLGGCTPVTPNWDARFGETVNMAVAAQTLHPDADRNQDPVAGIDGNAAQEAMTRYRKSFAAPEPQPNAFTIGVGRAGSASR